MTVRLTFWLVAAALMVWSLGAYNRLVRLRAQVVSSFAAVDQRMAQALDLLSEAVAAHENPAVPVSDDPDTLDGAVIARAGLQAAAAQFDVALRVARRQPLDASAVAALQASYMTARVAWDRYRAPAPKPDMAAMRRAWEDNAQVIRERQGGFNTAVKRYNAAIAQFPASVLAQVFGFGPAAPL